MKYQIKIKIEIETSNFQTAQCRAYQEENGEIQVNCMATCGEFHTISGELISGYIHVDEQLDCEVINYSDGFAVLEIEPITNTK